jgi:mannan endo-1,4-beta-mannosidase
VGPEGGPPVTARSRAALTLAATVAVILAAAAIAAVSIRHYHRQTAASPAPPAARAATPTPSVPAVVQASLPTTPDSYLGVYEGSSLTAGQYAQVDEFAQTVGRQPNIVLYYSSWGEPFSVSFAQMAQQHGATLLVDMDPTGTSVAAIADGEQDAFLVAYAQAVKVFGHPVIISFGHEMNGDWYPWGWTHTQPAVFVQAWRHIVDVFRRTGADNVTWLWTVNAVSAGEGPIADYWPGDNYVTWVAFDAYYYYADDDFSGVTAPTIAAIRQLTQDPILIGETAVGQVAGQAAMIPGLFAGVSTAGLLGFVWYDLAQDDGIYHQDWRLEGNPAAVAAFRAAAAAYLK